MATDRRVFVDARLAIGEVVALPPDTSHYLSRVLRLRAGDRVTLFDGSGDNFSAEILSADKKSAELKIVDSHPGPSSSPDLNLAISLLKGDKLDYALQKATELDAATIWLVQTERCELRLTEKRLENRMHHWQRIILSACEQSGRSRIPKLHLPQPLEGALNATTDMSRYCLEPSAQPGRLTVDDANVCLFTGPEGGFSSSESELLKQHCECVQLGELVLRAETAPLVGLALLSAARRSTL